MGKVSGVFEEAPEGQPFPYVTVDGIRSTSFRTLSRPGEEVTATLRVWSDTAGFAEAIGILDDLNRLLADRELTGPEGGQVFCRYVESEAGIDPDHPRRKVSVSYSLLVREPDQDSN